MNLDEVNSKFQSSVETLNSVWSEALEQINKGRAEFKSEIEELQRKNAELKEKYEAAQAKVDKIEDQLSNTVEQMKSMSKATDKGIDAMELLDVYLILICQ